MIVQITDLKIDWIWHLLLKIEVGVIGPTLLHFSIQNHIFRIFIPLTLLAYNKYKWNVNAKNVICNVIYLLKYSKVGPRTCIVFKIRSTFISRCHIQSIFRSVVQIRDGVLSLDFKVTPRVF